MMSVGEGKMDIWVYAHWQGMEQARLIGRLSVLQAKGKRAYSFEYDPDWLHSQAQLLLDPDIGWYSGPQYPQGKENFGLLLDSMPDRWGRTLMKRRAAQLAREAEEKPPTLFDVDFLLGVFDESRMGALRFKREKDSPFLSNDPDHAIPPISSVRELQYAASQIESDVDPEELRKWLPILLAPGSSLGGARPKANVLDSDGHPWIAKFPSHNDEIDKGAWEYLAYLLAIDAGIPMAPSRVEKVAGKHYTFFTRRFDRSGGERIHFASAMTMAGYHEEILRDQVPSYLEIAEFIQFSGAHPKEDLQQLWRRIVFNMAISNTDDHLRNHGFLLTPHGWGLSPAFDINPSVEKPGLALNVDMDDNALDIDLARSVGVYFQLNPKEMDNILAEVKASVKNWRKIATTIGIPRREQEVMEGAFWDN
jgi:serine/threonine-protein kinase HipA